eukprot:382737-Hanusia_phi.AAC.1
MTRELARGNAFQCPPRAVCSSEGGDGLTPQAAEPSRRSLVGPGLLHCYSEVPAVVSLASLDAAGFLSDLFSGD